MECEALCLFAHILHTNKERGYKNNISKTSRYFFDKVVQYMNSFTRSILQIFRGAVKAFESFPASILSALGFAIVTMIRIQLDWPKQEPYNFLFDCLHWSLALGAIFSLAAITIAQSRFNSQKAFRIANLISVLVVVATFLILYQFGGANTDLTVSRFAIVSSLAAGRVGIIILVSFLLFIIMAGYPKEQSDFARSFFMTHKAFFIALIYGAVIMGGASGVAGAVQALLYHDMSGKVYMYIGTLTGFLAFSIFVGYFPDFRKGQKDEHREIAQKQPRFVEVLLGYIMIPILLALTIVLFLWAGRMIVTGTWPVFYQLSGIATAYAAGGLWLHIMVTHHETGLSTFYRRIYPFAALFILAFEAWALFVQLGKSGLKITEYYFILVWIIAVAAAILLIIRQSKAHQAIVGLICAAAIISVLPIVGYHALPVAVQVDRLENLLVSQGMLENDRLVPAGVEPELTVRESITDAVDYIATAEDAKLPVWFDDRLDQSDVFKTKLGFEKVWPKPDDNNGSPGNLYTSLILKPEAIDISDYQWVIDLQEVDGKGSKATTIKSAKGLYQLDWIMNPPNGIPSIKIMLNDEVIIEKDMNDYIDQISEKYPPGITETTEATLKDMSLILETPEVTVLLVFNNINIYVDPQGDDISYWLDLRAVYLKENV